MYFSIQMQHYLCFADEFMRLVEPITLWADKDFFLSILHSCNPYGNTGSTPHL